MQGKEPTAPGPLKNTLVSQVKVDYHINARS